MGCCVTVGGAEFAVNDFIAETKLGNIESWHKGEQTRRGKTLDKSGVSISVSDADLSDLEGQIRDATSFLVGNRSELSKLARYRGVEEAYLSFAVEMADEIATFTFFPSNLVTLAGEIGLGIHFCQFRSTVGQKRSIGGVTS